MEFAGDSGSFVGNPPLSHEFALALCPLEPLLEGIGGLAAAAQVVAEHECGDQDDDAGDETADIEFVDQEPGEEQHADRRAGGDEQACPRSPDGVRAERIQGDEHPDEARSVDVGEFGDDLRRDDDRGRQDRIGPPPGDREHRCDDERDGPPCGLGVVLGRVDLGDVERHRQRR